MTSIRSDLKEQIERAILEVKTELRTEFRAALDRKAMSLETYVESRVNEVRQETSSTLEQLKETVAVVRVTGAPVAAPQGPTWWARTKLLTKIKLQ